MDMKMPPNTDESADNGYCMNRDSDDLNMPSEEVDPAEVDDLDEAAPENNPSDDWGEYMWMENEEEYDKEVLQQLEDEEFLHECMAYMHETGIPIPADNPATTTAVEGPQSANVTPWYNFKLNPDAEEFVPSEQKPNTEETSTESTRS